MPYDYPAILKGTPAAGVPSSAARGRGGARPPGAISQGVEKSMTNEEIFNTMQDLVAEQFAIEPEEVSMESSFEEDLGADSVDLVELVMAMEEEFDIGEVQEEELGTLKTVGDAVRYVAGKQN